MGQAKRRGNFEEMKDDVIYRELKCRAAMLDIERRKPSPKHALMMTVIASLALGLRGF